MICLQLLLWDLTDAGSATLLDRLPRKVRYCCSYSPWTKGTRGFLGCNWIDVLANAVFSFQSPQNRAGRQALALGGPQRSVCFSTVSLLLRLCLKGELGRNADHCLLIPKAVQDQKGQGCLFLPLIKRFFLTTPASWLRLTMVRTFSHRRKTQIKNKQIKNLCILASRPSIDMLCDNYEDLENPFPFSLQISVILKNLIWTPEVEYWVSLYSWCNNPSIQQPLSFPFPTSHLEFGDN